jgi:hypothetical protein
VTPHGSNVSMHESTLMYFKVYMYMCANKKLCPSVTFPPSSSKTWCDKV